jgi:hypothetical protein
VWNVDELFVQCCVGMSLVEVMTVVFRILCGYQYNVNFCKFCTLVIEIELSQSGRKVRKGEVPVAHYCGVEV